MDLNEVKILKSLSLDYPPWHECGHNLELLIEHLALINRCMLHISSRKWVQGLEVSL